MRYILTILTLACLSSCFGKLLSQHWAAADSTAAAFYDVEGKRADSLLREKTEQPPYRYTLFETPKTGSDSLIFTDPETLKRRADSLLRQQPPLSPTDVLLYASNPLILPLVYSGKDIQEVWDGNLRFSEPGTPLQQSLIGFEKPAPFSAEASIAALRNDARTYLANHHLSLYTTTIDRLPQLHSFMSRPIQGKRLRKLEVYDDKIVLPSSKIAYQTVRPVYWIRKANFLLQFTQNYVSPNWYQGGQSNLAFLSIFLAEFNYDSRKLVQWDNKLEWRAGFNSVQGDTLRRISTNDDLLRYLTKFGVKAGGNWYYSISGEFSTLLLNNYKGINSNELKGKLFTPVRANVGVGMDFKYKKIFSLMLAPVSFKYIYANDTVAVNPNLFGIEKGKNQLKQIGSSLLAQLNYSPLMNWNITSKLSCYTDYKKVEIDWEVVNIFTINRFLSARLLLNPRYDNTVILKGGEKARIQLKELMSVGFSYRFFR